MSQPAAVKKILQPAAAGTRKIECQRQAMFQFVARGVQPPLIFDHGRGPFGEPRYHTHPTHPHAHFVQRHRLPQPEPTVPVHGTADASPARRR